MSKAIWVWGVLVVVSLSACKRKPTESLVKDTSPPQMFTPPEQDVCVPQKANLPLVLRDKFLGFFQGGGPLANALPTAKAPSSIGAQNTFGNRMLQKVKEGSGDSLFADAIDFNYLIEMIERSYGASGGIGRACARFFLTGLQASQAVLGGPSVPVLQEQLTNVQVVPNGPKMQLVANTQSTWITPTGQTQIVGGKKIDLVFNAPTQEVTRTSSRTSPLPGPNLTQSNKQPALPGSTTRPEKKGLTAFKESLKRWGEINKIPAGNLGEVLDVIPLPGQQGTPIYYLALRRFLNQHMGLDFVTIVKDDMITNINPGAPNIKTLVPLPFRISALENENLNQALPETTVHIPGLFEGQFLDNVNSMGFAGNTLFMVIQVRSLVGVELAPGPSSQGAKSPGMRALISSFEPLIVTTQVPHKP